METQEDIVTPSSPAFFVWRVLAGGTLLVAAGMKVFYAPAIFAQGGLLAFPPLLYSAIFLELLIGGYALLGDRLIAWRAILAFYAVLAVVAGYSLVVGADCNCFGTWASTKLTLPFDLAIVISGIWVMPKGKIEIAPPLRKMALGISLGLGLAGVLGASYHVSIASQGQGMVDMLLTDSLIGKPWPIDGDVHPDLAPLAEGRWMVLLLSSDCHHCQQLVTEHFSDAQRHRSGERVATFLTGQKDWPFAFDRVSFDSNQGTIPWQDEPPFVANPAVFLLSDGVIVEASDGADTDEFLPSLFDEAASS